MIPYDYDLAVIGAGAAGMMAAVTAARKKANVLLLEKNDRVGKKLLSTGNGKCNFTNRSQDISCYHTECPDFLPVVLSNFTMEDTLRFFESIGISPYEKNGYFYPRSEQAASVSEAFFIELKHLGVTILTGQKNCEIKKQDQGFLICSGKKKWKVNKVILACGSKASRISGSDGSGYLLAERFGHTILPVVPALAALHTRNEAIKKIAGVRCQGRITLLALPARGKEQTLAKAEGELQFTKYGISGIPVFQVSRFASYALRKQQKVTAELDFFPEYSVEEWEQYIHQRKKNLKERRSEELFLGLLPEKLNFFLMEQAGILPKQKESERSGIDWQTWCRRMKQFRLPISGVNSFEEAQVCAGGVDLRELSSQMESKKVKGLYFAGEMVDVDGNCGGYNLQWAWSSGYVAGNAAAGDGDT